MTSKDRRILIFGSLIAGILLVAGAFWLSPGRADPFAVCRKGTVSGDFGGLGGSFELTDQNGQRVSDGQVLAEPALLYFGYTYCPDVCPLDNARNAEAVSILDQQGIAVRPVFISVDPGRDTPEVLKGFAQAMHPRMIGLTGTPDEIAKVAKSWRSYYMVKDQDDPENYLVDHTTSTYLIIPAAGTVEIFGRDIPAQEVADRSACFVTVAAEFDRSGKTP
ncbi:SCO family protein [Paracoccus sp. J56]|uniref:SCO family protein n=1 Tax=Paracoccus sp. J56 TaxID=935850 RepID=UPI000A0C87B8|nr:SCO family protein [Paracoccus sp. J56]SMG43180.1 protein SCO1/2 [Paracoccus sp. J56]